MSGSLFDARDILMRWLFASVFLCAPTIALMYLPARWAAGIALVCGFELRCVFLAFGAPFQQRRDT